MKVAICSYGITRKSGGVYYAVRDLFTNKVFQDYDLHLYSFYPKEYECDIKTWGNIPLTLYQANFFLYNNKMSKDIINNNFDLLHMETLWRYPQLIMEKWRNKSNHPIVCSPHGMLDPFIITNQGILKRLFARLIMQKSLEAVTCFHALCKKELEDIRSYGLKQPIAIIPNGIHMPIKKTIYTKIDNYKHLLYLGRLHKKKGIDYLLYAISQIKNQSPKLLTKWQIDIVGWDDEGFKSKLEDIVNKNNLQDTVVFHGELFGEAKDSIYATADAYILPSHGEGLPMTVLEAWSWKLPVIMTSKCNIPEGFEANAAIKVEDTLLSIKEGIIKLLKMSEEERQIMGQNGYQLVKEKFTWDKSAEKMLQLYKWLLYNTDKPDFIYE